MRPSIVRNIIASVAFTATAAIPAVAQAEDAPPEPYTIVLGARPMTLNEGQLVINGEFSFTGVKDSDTIIALDVGLDYAIMQNLQVGATALPLLLSPETDYGNPFIYGRYRFLRGATPVELGVELGATLPVQDGTDFAIHPGLLGSWQINKAAQLNFGIYVDLIFADELAKGLRIPLQLAISFTRQIFFTLDTGLNLPDFDADFMTIPLGVTVGYTLAKNADEPMLDLYLGFGFPGFVSPTISVDLSTGTAETSKDINTDVWTVLLGARFFAM